MELQKNNPRVKYLRKLSRRQFRQKENKFIIEGIRFVEELLDSGWPVEALFYSPKLHANARGGALIARAEREKIAAWQVADKLLAELADTENPQGVLALVNMPRYRLEDVVPQTQPALVVLVDGVQDPGNLGTIIRTADAAAATGVILLKGTVDLYNPKTLRSTMGSLFHLPVLAAENAVDTVNWLRSKGLKLVVGQPQGGAAIDKVDLTAGIVLVVGSEARGPSPGTISLADTITTIPMPGRAESLNAAVACAIMLYETVRQREEGK
ncbi:TrmH family RNA methyltransferase [Desulfohalotomaculum tongense]|uniref:TrmH family RNA methyltransferase n=1 Tax=Desulforadius tongensis TaxID=1216062 RepID=UPI001958C9E1|nr:RNA methyltransferase [Desulforadius tongensis]MBM7854780.1 TrmH family RNA methyltransferase [Desulforadius tongensis]